MSKECKIFSIAGNRQALALTCCALEYMQNDSNNNIGIILKDGMKYSSKSSAGKISSCISKADINNMKGDVCLGILESGKAPYINGAYVNVGRNSIAITTSGSIKNAESLSSKLEETGSMFMTRSDSELLAHLIKRESGKMLNRVMQSLLKLEGSFVATILDNDTLYVARDKNGIARVSIGKMKDGTYVFTSETAVMNIIGARFIREVSPGEVVYIKDGKLMSSQYADVQKKICIMEYLCNAREGELIDGIDITNFRKKLSNKLANVEIPEVDYVMPVTGRSTSYAVAYAEARNMLLRLGVEKLNISSMYKEMSACAINGFKIATSGIRGKRILLIDTIMKESELCEVVRLLKNAGAKEVHVRYLCPRINFKCTYNIQKEEYFNELCIENNNDNLCKKANADSIEFISKIDIYKALEESRIKWTKVETNVCMNCLNAKVNK